MFSKSAAMKGLSKEEVAVLKNLKGSIASSALFCACNFEDGLFSDSAKNGRGSKDANDVPFCSVE